MGKVLLSLSREDYRALVEIAQRESRDVDQQAAYLLKRTLSRDSPDRACVPPSAASEEAARAGVA
jgi:hypothetical protein